MEFDFRWLVGEHLTVTGGAGWVDAEFKEGSSVINVNSVRTPLGNDNFPPWINKYSYTLSGQYERPISNNMTITGRVDWLGKGPFWFNMENTARNPGWDVVNARIALKIGTIWTLGFNVENIFDEDYYVDGSVWPGDAVPGTPAPNYDPVIGTLGQPRPTDGRPARQPLVTGGQPIKVIHYCVERVQLFQWRDVTAVRDHATLGLLDRGGKDLSISGRD